MTNIKIHKKSIGSSQNFPSIYLKWNISSIPLIMGGGGHRNVDINILSVVTQLTESFWVLSESTIL